MTKIRASNFSSPLDLSGIELKFPETTSSVKFYDARNSFPSVGEASVLYVAKDTGQFWFWSAPASDFALFSHRLDAGTY